MKYSVNLVCAAALALSCCVGCAGSMKADRNSGFLSDYARLQEGPEGGVARLYVKAGPGLANYDKVMFDRVVFYLKDDAGNKAIDPDEMQQLAQRFHAAVVAAVNDAYPMVDRPGPGVLRVRVAITGYDPPREVLNAISTVVPVGLGVSLVKQGITGRGTGCGDISMEFEFLDSQTGDVLAAGVDRRSGGKLDSMTKFGTADEAFEYWSKRLRMRLDMAHGKTL